MSIFSFRKTSLSFFFIVACLTVQAAPPVISSVTIPAGNYKIGDIITVTIASDGTGYTVDAGTTVNGVDVTGTFAFVGGNSYTLSYTVGSGNTDRASVGAIPINILIRSAPGGGNLNTYTTAPTSPGTVTIDANAPAQPSSPTLQAATDLGTSNSDKITSDNTPNFTGSGTNGNTITVISSLDGIKGTGVVAGGTYTITVTALSEDTHSITVTETDPAGNVSIASSALTNVVIDVTAPNQPGAPNLTAATDLGSSNSDNITSDVTPDFSGSETTGNTITVISSIDGVVGSGLVVSGNYSITVSMLSEGTHSVTVTETDVAGNTSIASNALSPVVIDTTPPTAPSAADLVAGSDSGLSSTDNNTNDNTPTFDVTGINGVRLEIFNGTTVVASTASATGVLQQLTSSSPLADGVYSITARSVDVAGNTASSAVLALTIDTTNPTAPSVPDLTAATDSGLSNTDNNTNDNTPDFTVTGTIGLQLEILRGGSIVIATTASATGAETFSPNVS